MYDVLNTKMMERGVFLMFENTHGNTINILRPFLPFVSLEDRYCLQGRLELSGLESLMFMFKGKTRSSHQIICGGFWTNSKPKVNKRVGWDFTTLADQQLTVIVYEQYVDPGSNLWVSANQVCHTNVNSIDRD